MSLQSLLPTFRVVGYERSVSVRTEKRTDVNCNYFIQQYLSIISKIILLHFSFIRSTPGGPEHPLFRGWGKQSSRSPFGRRLVEVVSDRSKWPAHLLKPSAPSSEFLKVDASSGTDIERAVPSGRASSGRFVYLSMGDCSARHEVVEPPKPKVEPTIEPKTEASTLLPKDNNRSNRRSTVLYSRTMTFSSPPSSSRPPIEASPTRRRQLLSFLLPKLPADGAARARAAALSGRVVRDKI